MSEVIIGKVQYALLNLKTAKFPGQKATIGYGSKCVPSRPLRETCPTLLMHVCPDDRRIRPKGTGWLARARSYPSIGVRKHVTSPPLPCYPLHLGNT